MSRRVDELPGCSACGGTLFPLVLCDTCGAATVLRNAQKLDWAAPCAECGTFNPWQLVCDKCQSRFPAPGVSARHAAAPAETPAGSTTSASGVVRAPKGRPTRRIRGDMDTRALVDMLRILGLDPSRSQALIERGYDGLWKIARATESELSRIPEVGPVAARKVVASFHLLNYSPPQRTKESIVREEYECPLCRCVTSAFASTCMECGAAFDEEEMDEAIRHELTDEPDAIALAFYDGRLAEKPDEPELLYARGLLLETLDRTDEAIEVFARAASKAPDAKKIKVALLRTQAKHPRTPAAAARLRSTASALLDDVAWDQEIAELDQLITEAEPACPTCGATVPNDAAECPACRAPLRVVPEAAVPASPEPVPSPELDTLVDDLLVGELEESLSADELERTKAAVLDWLIQELEESMAPDDRVTLPAEQRPPHAHV